MIPQFLKELTENTPEETRQIIFAAWENGYNKGYNKGYEEGFQVAQVAERGIIKVQSKINEIDQASQTPANHTSNPAGGPGLHPIFSEIFKPFML